jgi:hypothetical protein
VAQTDALYGGRDAIAIGGEEIEQRGVEIGKQALTVGDADQRAHHALRHRARVVERLRVEGDLSEGAAPALVATPEVTLEDEASLAHDEDGVQVPELTPRGTRGDLFEGALPESYGGGSGGGPRLRDDPRRTASRGCTAWRCRLA